jgi:membrane protease YdiL (CAAX protease family)
VLPWLTLYFLIALGLALLLYPRRGAILRFFDPREGLRAGWALVILASFPLITAACTISVVLLIVGWGALAGIRHAGVMNLIHSFTLVPAVVSSYVVTGLVVTYLLKKALGLSTRAEAVRAVGGSLATGRANLIGAAAGLALALLMVLVTPHLHPPPRSISPLRFPIPALGWGRNVWIFCAVVIVPPVEELIFRGALLVGFTRSWGPTAAGTATTLLFVAGHLRSTHQWWPALAAIACVGVMTLIARLQTNSLSPGVAIHAAYNFGLVVPILTVGWFR